MCIRDSIKVIANEKNIGLAASLNTGIQAASASLIARMDADDISMSTRLEKQVSFLSKHPSVHIVGAGIIEMNQAGETGLTQILPEEHSDIITRVFK